MRRWQEPAPFYLSIMKILVLGSAAGGGFPQWNCNCPNCAGVRQQNIRAIPRTQSSIAISADGIQWLLVNASPDILKQIQANPALQPARAIRDTGIKSVILMDAQIDHVTGLLMLRESGTPLPLYCTQPVWNDLNTGLPLVPVLSHYCGVEHRPISVDDNAFGPALHVPGMQDISITPFPLSSKAPPYSPNRNNPQTGDNIGLLITNEKTGKSAFYAPGLGQIEPLVLEAMNRADCVLVDGTVWTEDEMIQRGLSKKTAAEMGHLPQSGPQGMISVLDSLGNNKRKILIHINNSNPILNQDSDEAAVLQRHAIEIAVDGMEITL